MSLDIEKIVAFRPDPEKLTQLAAALRSGQYKQAFGRLRRLSSSGGQPCYCALGVVVEVFAPERWNGDHPDGNALGMDYEGTAELLGCSEPDHRGEVGGAFVEANDGCEQSFTSMAEELEQAAALVRAGKEA